MLTSTLVMIRRLVLDLEGTIVHPKSEALLTVEIRQGRSSFEVQLRSHLRMAIRRSQHPYFFFAPTRSMLLIASVPRPDFSAISRSCSRM
jgi:hypothetical protein